MQIRFRLLWLAAALALSGGVAPLQSQQTNIDRDLEEAKTLYREARFTDAIVRLQTTIDRLKLLEKLQGRRADLADAYLHLGLSYFALADLHTTKEQLKNVLKVDPSRRLDPQVYAPAVVQLFEEARKEQSEGQAQAVSPTAPQPSPSASAPGKGGSKALPLVLGAAAVSGVGVALARGGSNGSRPAPAAGATPTPASTVSPTPSPTMSPTPDPGLSGFNITFLGSDPPPGSTISVSGGAPILRVQASAVANQTGTFLVYAIDLHPTGRQCVCGWSGLHEFTSGQPITGITVTLDYRCGAPLFGGLNCPSLPYTANGLAISLVDRNVRSQLHVQEFALAYTFRP